MRDFIICLNETQDKIEVMEKKDYLMNKEQFTYIDDSDSEYKAQIKAKEISSMGIKVYKKLKAN